jgi:pyridoxine 5-phosphate synthase
MIGLGVNIDHVATVRQARRTVEPDPVWAAVEAQLAGADCITFHLRQDRRHITDRDVPLLKEVAQVKLNMEMSLAEEIVEIALRVRPDQATLVPENRQEVTTEGGLDVAGQRDRVAAVVERLRGAGIVTSAFIDPEPEQIAASVEAGFDAVELHTGSYANACQARSPAEAETLAEAALDALDEGLRAALGEGLVVHAGHGLTYQNVADVAALGGFTEFNIGHSIIARAIFVGLGEAVAEMKDAIAAGEA